MINWLAHQAHNWRRHLGTLSIAMAALFAVQAWQTRAVHTGPLNAEVLSARVTLLQPGQAPALMDLREALRRVATDQAQPVALYVWADWCPICSTLRSTADSFARAHPTLTVAMRSGPAPNVQAYLGQHQLDWPTLVDENGALTRALGFGAVPAFAVITPDGDLQTPTVGLTSGWGMRLRWWWAKLSSAV